MACFVRSYIKLEHMDAEKVHRYMHERGVTTRLFQDAGKNHMRITAAVLIHGSFSWKAKKNTPWRWM